MLKGSWVLKMGYTSVFVILALCSVTDTFGRSGKNKGSNYWMQFDVPAPPTTPRPRVGVVSCPAPSKKIVAD